MGLHDRPYWKHDSSGGFGGGRRIAFSLPKPTPAVKALVIINVAVFVLQQILLSKGYAMSASLGVTVNAFWQVWRYITFQFLHSGIRHILFNMLCVYFFGLPLEQQWGRRKFLAFYLSCGAVAGFAYVIIGALSSVSSGMPIIGASGGVYGLLLACAVYFPQFRIFLLIPIRLAVVIGGGVMILRVLQDLGSGSPDTAMSDVAHLGGAAAAAFYIWLLPRIRGTQRRVVEGLNEGAWQRKMRDRAEEQAELDRILQKIHNQGVGSLTRKEKDSLQKATKSQRDREKEVYRS